MISVVSKIKFFYICLIVLVSASFASNTYAADRNLFPLPAELEPDVEFWIKIFSEVDTRHGFIHDDKHLGVVYEKIALPKTKSRRARSKHVKSVKKRYRKILNKLSMGRRSGLSAEEQRVLNLWPRNVSNQTLRAAKQRIRFQLGQSDKYLAGLVRSGAWRPHILANLKKMGLPEEISALPHVESSFNPKAYSKVGAAGLWQFTRSTGRRFMRIDHVVDERMDPFKASIAAAQLLENNYAVTTTWPLALTAYNHGAAGMRNAAKRMGTHDITTILRRYKSRSFKFASRNFYVAFLAALEIQENIPKYFGTVKLNPEITDDIIKLPAYMSVKSVSKSLGISKNELKRKNPALRASVWTGQKYIPKNYPLRIAENSKKRFKISNPLKKVASSKRFRKQKRDLYHRVRRGQTLSTIAARYGVRVRDLVAANSLRSRHRIRVGQRLRLPNNSKKYGSTRVASNKKSRSRKIPQNGLYKVRRGDSINKIAKRYRVKRNDLLAFNDLNKRSKIYPGQKLYLKKPAAKVQATTAIPVMVALADTESTVASIQSTSPLPSTSVAVEQGTGSGISLQKQPNEADTAVTTPITESTAIDITADNTNTEHEQTESTSVATMESTSEQSVMDIASKPAIVTEPVVAVQEDVEEALIEAQPELSADPTDYSVSRNNSIEVQAEETLGHYAEWLNLRASRLRRVNRMRFGKPVVVGKRLKLDFSRVTHEQFETNRLQFHKEIQDIFFERYRISGSKQHKIRRGDSLWKLAKHRYKVPLWLLRQYNPDLELNKVRRGSLVTFPKLEKRIENKNDDSNSTPGDNTRNTVAKNKNLAVRN